jgi:hypothetical protein
MFRRNIISDMSEAREFGIICGRKKIKEMAGSSDVRRTRAGEGLLEDQVYDISY